MIGFVSFILLLFTILFAVALIAILSFHPSWLIKDISEAMGMFP